MLAGPQAEGEGRLQLCPCPRGFRAHASLQGMWGLFSMLQSLYSATSLWVQSQGPRARFPVLALGYLKVFATAHSTSGHPTVQGGFPSAHEQP